MNFIRSRADHRPRLRLPYPYGGKQRQIMVDIDTSLLQSKGISPADVMNAVQRRT